jgi:AcrR family transcriptional regulator
MPIGKRARDDDEKEERRQQILDGARRLFDERTFSDISVSAVAREVGVAKGTLYIYFDSKEALFLDLLLSEMSEWFEAVAAVVPRPATVEQVARVITEELVKRPQLPRLAGILHSVLEHNIGDELALEFKQEQRRFMAEGAERLSAVVDGLEPPAAEEFFIRLHATVVGVALMANPSETVRAALRSRDGLELLDIEFDRMLQPMVELILNDAIA